MPKDLTISLIVMALEMLMVVVVIFSKPTVFYNRHNLPKVVSRTNEQLKV